MEYKEDDVVVVVQEKVDLMKDSANGGGNTVTIIANSAESNQIDEKISTSTIPPPSPTINNANKNALSAIPIKVVKLDAYPHPLGKYPVHEAVYKNDVQVLKQLLGEEGNSSIYLQQQQQQNEGGNEEEEEENENDANADAGNGRPGINERDDFGKTPLMYCNTVEVARFLLERGARLNLRDHERQTAMHKASSYNLAGLLALYLDLGAHIKRDSSGCTPLHICGHKGFVHSANAMMEKGPRRVKAEARDKAGKTPLHYAAESSENDDVSAQVVQIMVNGGSLLDTKDREKKTPLHYATIRGKVKTVNVLLEKGANPDIADLFGALPLHYAVTCVLGRKIAKQLVNKGSKVNAPDNMGQTPIFYASKSGLPKNVTSLLRLGASATVKDYQNKTPLHFSLDIANPTISSMLVSAGADVTLRYKYGPKGEKGAGTISRKWKGETSAEVIDDEMNHADIYGFLPDVALTASQLKRWHECKEFYSELFKANHDKEKSREKIWLKIIKQWSSKYKNKPRFVNSLAWKTVPESVRGSLWRIVLNPDATKEKYADRVVYQSLLDINSEFVKQIDLDIDRTYRNHYIFRERFNVGQQSLFNILKAYSVFDPEVGYCQGMSSIVAILLMYLNEEECFWSLVSLMYSEKYALRGLFLPSFPLLYRNYSIHEALLHQELPKVQNHFNVEGINSSMYSTKWFLTVFSGNVPFPVLVRFWDLLLLHGYFIIHSFAIQTLREHSDVLTTEGFEKILNFFSTLEFNKINLYSFFKSCKKNRIPEKKIDKLIKQYQQTQAQLHISPVPIKPRSQSIFSANPPPPPSGSTTITSTTTTITSTTTTTIQL